MEQMLSLIKRIPVRELLIIISVGFIIILSTLLVQSKRSLEGTKSILEVQKDSIRYYESVTGELIAQKRSNNLTTKQLKENLELLDLDKSKLKKQVGNLNNLVARLQADIQAKGEGVTVIEDTIIVIDYIDQPFDYKANFDWSNNFISISGQYKTLIKNQNNSYIFSNQAVHLTYSYNLSFTTTTYYKRPEGFLKPKELYIDIQFTDPSVVVSNMNNIHIKPPQKTILDRKLVWFLFGASSSFILTR